MGKICFGNEIVKGEFRISELKVSGFMEGISQNGKKVVYVSQDNFYIVDLDCSKDTIYYCDSATSCIVVITVGYSSHFDKKVAIISHLSRPGRFDDYFSKVEALFGDNEMVKLYASGANPPERYKKQDGTYDTTALRNATQVVKWVSSGKVNLEQVSLKFGQGNPAIYTNNLDCYSLVCGGDGGCEITNNRIYLTDEQRDPTNGVQTLFCIYGDSNVIRDQSEAFTDEEIDRYVSMAISAGLQKAEYMSDEEILTHYSSTPQYEVPWFCDSIRQAAKFVNKYKRMV